MKVWILALLLAITSTERVMLLHRTPAEIVDAVRAYFPYANVKEVTGGGVEFEGTEAQRAEVKELVDILDGERQPLVRCSLRWAGDTAVRWDTVGESRLRVGRYTAPRPEFRLTASDHSGMVIQAAAAPYSQPVPFWFGCKDNGVSAEITLNGPTDRGSFGCTWSSVFHLSGFDAALCRLTELRVGETLVVERTTPTSDLLPILGPVTGDLRVRRLWLTFTLDSV